jgi:uncharacterized membrane protein YdjX (TVP38/TMEM64 family)
MRRKLFVLVGFALLLIAILWLVQRWQPREALIDHENRLRASIAEQPLIAWALGFIVYTALSLVPGTGGKSMVFGWLFGLWPAVLMVDCALTAAAIITFCVSRIAFRDVVETRFRNNVQRINRGLSREGAFYLLLLRLTHMPFTFINYACGATRVEARTFWWTTQLGVLPGTIVFVFAGSRVPRLRDLLDRGLMELIDPWLIGGLVLTALLPILIRTVIRRTRLRTERDIPAALRSP